MYHWYIWVGAYRRYGGINFHTTQSFINLEHRSYKINQCILASCDTFSTSRRIGALNHQTFHVLLGEIPLAVIPVEDEGREEELNSRVWTPEALRLMHNINANIIDRLDVDDMEAEMLQLADKGIGSYAQLWVNRVEKWYVKRVEPSARRVSTHGQN